MSDKNIVRIVEEAAPVPDAKIVIKIERGQVARAVDAAEAALVAAGVPILVRAGALVRPVVDVMVAADGGKTEATVLKQLGAENIIYDLNKHAAVFLVWNEKEKKFVESNPPVNVARTLLCKNEWAFPKVAGIITAPTLRPDGSVLDRPGYDPATQLWYAPDSRMAPPIKVAPTKDEAGQALALYRNLLVNFPFVTDVDRSVALAAVLTTVLRGAFDVSPMFLFVAHDVGSGKSYLVNLISTIARGRPCPVITNVESVEEMEKRLGALVLAGAPMISLDNCSADLSGDLLCQITEQQLIRIRILGRSEAPECEWRGTMFGTGNNVSFVGDMARRGLRAIIDPRVERAELRTFSFDPIARVLADRGAYAGAAITIARAYLASGERVRCSSIASYGKWSQVAREPLIWLGEEDPVKSMDAVREADPVRNAVCELITNWESDLFIDVGYTASELRKAAIEVDERGHLMRPALRELLLQQAGNPRGEIDTRRLGNWLSGVVGRIHGGHRIELPKKDTRAGNRYALVPVRLV